MGGAHEKWERLVTATIRREQLIQTALMTSSDVSSVSPSPSPSSILVSFSYHQLLAATNRFATSNLLKHGHSGDLYLGLLDSGILVVVKKVNMSSLEKRQCVLAEKETGALLNNLNLSRLLPLTGHCLEEDEDHKFLVYDYMDNGDLSVFLSDDYSSSLDWTCHWSCRGFTFSASFPTLCSQVMRAVEIIMCECGAHSFLFAICVIGTFKLAAFYLTMIFKCGWAAFQGSVVKEKTLTKTGLRGSCDCPGASNATCAYDVYCFGKVLLELVTGKISIESIDDSRMKDWVAETLQYVIASDKKLIINIIDSSLSMNDHLLVEVWGVALVANACLNPKPSKRPKITEILKALQNIKLARLTDAELNPGCISTSFEHGFFATGRSVRFYPNGKLLPRPSLKVFTFLELKDATTNFGMENWLGQDEFGRVYRGLIRDKLMDGVSVIAVKRMNLKAEKGFQEWQSEVEMLGRLSHPNVLGPLGYCLEDNELIVVYEFMQNGSLKNILFQSDSAIQLLSWDSRLKILIGTAKGLAFLHAAERRRYFPHKKERGGFYGYFKCSKILIDSNYNAKITGFGVAEVNPPDDVHEVHPLQFTNRVDEYAAPEYKIEGKLALESDVYGFGVVLVRMLTGSDNYHPLANLGQRTFIEDKMDPQLQGNFPLGAASKVAHLACLCLQQDLKLRPGMKRVSWILQDIATNSK